MLDIQASHNSLFLPMSGKETKGHYEAYLLGVFGTDSYSVMSGVKKFLAVSVVVWMVMVICSGIAHTPRW